MHVDLLIITALKDELDALVALHAGWETHTDQFGLEYHHLRHPNRDRQLISVVAAWCGDMGEGAAAARAAALVTELRPTALGMCGICAGKRGDTSLGDIIVADRVYSYDHGKLIARTAPGGERVEDFYHDITTYNLPLAWKMAASVLGANFETRADIVDARPLIIEAQRTWLLRALEARDADGGPDPYDLPDRPAACPDWAKAIVSLEKAGLATVTGKAIKPTTSGLEFAQSHRTRHRVWAPGNRPFKVHGESSAIATGKTVREDPELFARLARVVRKTIGVEMEAAAIGHVGRYANIPTIVVKAVSDHGDGDKDDSYREFACKVSAQFLLAFAEAHIGPGGGSVQKKLASSTEQWRRDVKDHLRGAVRLAREKAVTALLESHAVNRTSIVLGESGSGKSALVKSSLADTGESLAAYADEIVALDEAETIAFLGARTSPTTLIVDAAERLANEADCRTIARFIRAMRLDCPDTPWRLVVTCQTLHWPALKGRLEGTDFSWGTRAVLEPPPLAPDEIDAVARAFPKLARILGRHDLAPLTSQMKILDLLCDAAADGELPATERWVGESDFIDWYWDYYFRRDGRGDDHAAAVQILARDQADEHRFGTALALVRASDTALLPMLIAAGVITRREDVVRFAHDLYADYARARYLLSELRTERFDELRRRITNPLWHRAFRLLGLRLLESGAGDVARAVDEWSRLCVLLGSASSGAFDLLVEAIPFAASPERLLNQLLPQLLADEGRLLRRFLLRFLYVTTLPHQRVLDMLRDKSREVQTQAEVRWREPILRLWLPVLRWVVKHGRDIVTHAPDELVAIAEPWLLIGRMIEGLPLRKELAALIHEIAEKIDQSSYWHAPVDDAERLYTVLIAAGPTAPERFRKIIRRYAGLEAPPPQAPVDFSDVPDDRKYLLERLVPTVSVGPWPGGPVADSNDEFAKVALEDPGAGWLVEIDAELAREVFTALLIEPPHERSYGDLRDHECELRHPELGFLPTSRFAPVRHLLDAAPDLGRQLVEHLADFATKRWLEPIAPIAPPDPGDAILELHVAGRVRQYVGAGDPFHWHLSGSNGPKPLKAALMTLEQWLYDLIDSKKLEASQVADILSSTKSVAVLGVLLELALLYPPLLLSSLEAFATSADFLLLAASRDALLWQPLLFATAREAHEFAKLEHRKRDLLRVVVYLFARRNLEWPAIEATRQRWVALLDTLPRGRFHDWVELLVAQFDPVNWKHVTAPDGQTGLEYQPPPDLAARNEGERASIDSTMRIESIPLRCRRTIDGEEDITCSQLLEMLEVVGALHDLPQNTAWVVGGVAGVRCAVAALALLKFPEWLAENAHWRERSVEWVRNALAATREADQDANRVDVRDWTWDVFAADVVPVLMAAAPEDATLREAAVTLVSFPHDVAVRRFFVAAAAALPSTTLGELLHLATAFAAATQATPPWSPNRVVSTTFTEKARAFIAGTLAPLPPTWWTQAGDHDLDDGYLVLAFSWINGRLNSDEPIEESVRTTVVGLAERVLSRLRSLEYEATDVLPPFPGPGLELVRLPRKGAFKACLCRLTRPLRSLFARPTRSPARVFERPTKRLRSHERPIPYESDRVIVGWLARILVCEPRADRRRALWEPWMRLPLYCEHFIELFLGDIYAVGLDDDAPFFVDLLREIGAFLRTNGWLQRGAGRPEHGVAVSLIGRSHFALPNERWSAARAPIALRCRDFWREWLDATHDWHGCLADFCDLLCAPAFSGLRIEGLSWIACYDTRRMMREPEAQDSVARLLELITVEHAADLAADASARRALESLLEPLLASANKRAIVLTAKMRSAGAE